MPGQYSSHCRTRPCALLPAAATTARLFLCVRCRTQALVCGHCDRGQIYCAQGCTDGSARRPARGRAALPGQPPRSGEPCGAGRSLSRRQNNVTHQGSPPRPADDLVMASAVVIASNPPSASPGEVARPSPGHRSGSWSCHWCECRCPPFVRREFLRRRTGSIRRQTSSRRTA